MSLHTIRFLLCGVLGLSAALYFSLSLPAQGTGEAVFKAKCGMCQGPDAAGKRPMGHTLKVPDLHSEQAQKMTEPELKAVIAKGKNKMPGYEGKLSKDQIEKLVAYIRALAKH